MGGCQARAVTRVIPHAHVRRNSFDAETVNKEKNLESYYLFWLDPTARSPEYLEIPDELRSIINHVRIFESFHQCQIEINKVLTGKIFLLTDILHGLPCLNLIHDHPTLDSVYMYGSTNNTFEIPRATFHKIRGIYDSLSMAKRYLEDDVRLHIDFDGAMVMNLPGDDLEDVDYREKFKLFLNLVRINSTNVIDESDENRLMTKWRIYYANNAKEKNFIEEFHRTYQPAQVFFWYSRGSCLHRLMNRAFLEQDLAILVDMFSFIVDIDQHIRSDQSTMNTNVQLYRGQFLSDDDLSIFRSSQSEILTMQCFFTAQKSREEAEKLLQTIQPNNLSLKRVLFEINAKQNYRKLDGEGTSEIMIFTLGTRFHIDQVTETTIKLTQCDDEPTSFNHESRMIVRGLLNYLKKGTKDALIYFQQQLRIVDENDSATRTSIYGQMAYLHQRSNQSKLATDCYEQSLHHGVKQFHLFLFYLDQAARHHGELLADWTKAKQLWHQKLSIEKQLGLEQEKRHTYKSLINAALQTEQYAELLEYSKAALDGLPSNHSDFQFFQQQRQIAEKKMSSTT